MVVVCQNGMVFLQMLGLVYEVGNGGCGSAFCSADDQFRVEVSAGEEIKVTKQNINMLIRPGHSL